MLFLTRVETEAMHRKELYRKDAGFTMSLLMEDLTEHTILVDRTECSAATASQATEGFEKQAGYLKWCRERTAAVSASTGNFGVRTIGNEAATHLQAQRIKWLITSEYLSYLSSAGTTYRDCKMLLVYSIMLNDMFLTNVNITQCSNKCDQCCAGNLYSTQSNQTMEYCTRCRRRIIAYVKRSQPYLVGVALRSDAGGRHFTKATLPA